MYGWIVYHLILYSIIVFSANIQNFYVKFILFTARFCSIFILTFRRFFFRGEGVHTPGGLF